MNQVLRIFIVDPLRELWRPGARQIEALDFLRASAVLMVVLYHLREAYLGHGGETSWLTGLPPLKYGVFGVDLFFVLSGYLIGGQLWRELAANGTINIQRFLLRRGLRIWPLYFAFMGLLALYPIPSYYRHADAVWWSDFFYLSNYSNRGLVDGSWSLCTEEQFYLLLPVLLLVAWQFPALRMRAWWLWALLGALPLVRLAQWWFMNGNLEPNNEFFVRYMSFPIHVRCDGLFAGVLVALLETRNAALETRNTDATRRSGLSAVWTIAVAFLVGAALCVWQRWIFCFAAASWIFAATTANLITRPWFLQRFFNCRIFFWLSRLSYGMYLNHMYLFEPVARWTLLHVPGAAQYPLLHFGATSLVLVASSMAIALLTYCLIEHPFIALRDAMLKARLRVSSEFATDAALPASTP